MFDIIIQRQQSYLTFFFFNIGKCSWDVCIVHIVLPIQSFPVRNTMQQQRLNTSRKQKIKILYCSLWIM